MIELKNIKKIYKNGDCKTIALNGMNLNIEKGEFVAIMGKSGSGKSTLLNIIGCMDTITSGEYLYNSVEINKLNKRKIEKYRKENISFVFQNYSLINEYTVYENIEVPLLARNVKKSERKKRINDVIESLDIKDIVNKKTSDISGGQQQRTAIARAIVANTNIILADEPTGALDENTSKDIMKLFKKINKQGYTIIMVTHDIEMANNADRIIRISDGVIIK